MDAGRDIADGRYRLVERLGAGGMAEVWRVWDARLRVWRAVKVLSAHHVSSSGIVQRFDNEARTMARLRHPHLLAVHDVGWADDRPFLVMDLLPGGSLEDHRRRVGRFPPKAAARLVASVLDGLAFAHAAGVVHRDVKPHNVLIEASGSPVLADFGIARLADDRSNPTRTGMALGTLAYMAPEQRTHARSVDGRADLYAAGATLVALLTGADPYDLHVEAALAEQLRDVPPAIGAVITRATRWEPDQRFADAAEMAAALRSAVEALPDEAPLDLSYTIDGPPPPDSSATFADTDGPSLDATWAPEPPAKTLPQPETASTLPQAALPTTTPGTPGRAGWLAVGLAAALAAGGAVWTLVPASPALEPVDLSDFPLGAALSPDGASLVGVIDGAIAERPLAGGALTRWPAPPSAVAEIAFGGDPASVVARLADGSFSRLGRDGSAVPLGLDAGAAYPSPIDERLLLVREDGLFLSSEAGVRRVVRIDAAEAIFDVAWSPDGARALLGINTSNSRGREARVDLVDVASGERVASAGLPGGLQVESVAFVGPDRAWVGGTTTAGRAQLWGVPLDARGLGAPEVLQTHPTGNDLRIDGVVDGRALLVVQRWERDVWTLDGREATPTATADEIRELAGDFQGDELLYSWSSGLGADLVVGVRRAGADPEVPGGDGASWPAVAGDTMVWWRQAGGQCGLERRAPGSDANEALFSIEAETSVIPCPFIACDREGRVCVTADGTSMLRFDPTTGERRALDIPSVPNGVSFDVDPAGGRLALLHNAGIEVHPMEGGAPVTLPFPSGVEPRHLGWSATGERIWVASSCDLQDDCLGLLDSQGGFERRFDVPPGTFIGLHLAVDERDRVGFTLVHKVKEGLLARP